MKKNTAIFLQGVLAILGIGVLTLMLWQPQLEGRNVNATTFEIYFKDPFLAFAYISSIAFFVGLYQAFKALGYVRENKTFSQETAKALRTIKHCAMTLVVLIVMAAVYIRVFHAKDDDPAGFIALCIVATFISVIVAATARMFERTINLKSQNDLTA